MDRSKCLRLFFDSKFLHQDTPNKYVVRRSAVMFDTFDRFMSRLICSIFASHLGVVYKFCVSIMEAKMAHDVW